MTRDEHLAWCKQRALEYVDAGKLSDAVVSMASDMEKHPETDSVNLHLMMVGMMHVRERDTAGVRRWIEGFR